MTKRIHITLFHALLLTVYASFFSVQFFFNFEGVSNRKNPFHADASAAPAALTAPQISVAKSNLPGSPSSTHTVRLNKRFHQEDIPPCHVLCVEAPERNILPKAPGLQRVDFLPSAPLLHHSLRGPPFIV